MLKLYVETINRLGLSATSVRERISSREDESGFASAETIALAVAGVLIAGVAYRAFDAQI